MLKNVVTDLEKFFAVIKARFYMFYIYSMFYIAAKTTKINLLLITQKYVFLFILWMVDDDMNKT